MLGGLVVWFLWPRLPVPSPVVRRSTEKPMTKRLDPHSSPPSEALPEEEALRSAEWMPVYVPGAEQSALFEVDASSPSSSTPAPASPSHSSQISTTTQAVGGSTLFQISGLVFDADPADADDFMPVYLPAGVKSSPQNPRVEVGASAADRRDEGDADQTGAMGGGADDDDDFLPLYLSPSAPGGTSTLFDLARLGAQIPVKLSPTGDSTLFRLADGTDVSVQDTDPEEDEDLMPVYLSGNLPGDLTQPRTRQHSSLFLLGDAEGGDEDEDFLPVFVSGQVPPPSAAEAALDARLRQQTRRVIAPPKPKPVAPVAPPPPHPLLKRPSAATILAPSAPSPRSSGKVTAS